MFYHWLSFSKLAAPGEVGNLGALVLTSERELTAEEAMETARSKGLVPDGTVSMEGGILDEEDAAPYPHDRLITYQELLGYEGMVHTRTAVPICDACIEELSHEPN